MAKLLLLACLSVSVLLSSYSLAKPAQKQLNSFVEYDLVPTHIDAAPSSLLEVVFPSGVVVQEGNELTPTEVKDLPTLTWDANPDAFYVVTLIDVDAPFREDPFFSAYQHWLVGNVPGSDLAAGETIRGFLSSGPGEGSGLHRYIFLVYQQPSELVFDEPRASSLEDANRAYTNINEFAAKYNLGEPVAGNFYQAQFDEYVLILNEIMGW